MCKITKQSLFGGLIITLLTWCTTPSNVYAQLVTNGGFESSNTGIVDTTAVKGWLIQVDSGITPPPVFEIVSDTVEQGNRALKVTVHGLGTNQWDMQAVADSIPVEPGSTYSYSIWAKSDKPGATVNFTMGNYSYTEYGAIRPATLSTQWQKFTMQFTVNDGQTYIRGPIHFYGTVDTGNSVYIDNLQIVDVNAGKKPVVVEAEAGTLGSYFKTLQDGNVTYVSTDSNWTSITSPGDTTRMMTFQVHFAD
jgi:endo-1,4-beta-xylanase